MEDNLAELIKTIKGIKSKGIIQNYIEYIQFPFFKNLEVDQRINFDFPLTVFVGPNGSGKSSALHALYGCPAGKTPYEFWFSTVLDTITYYSTDGRKLRHSFFYGYKDNNKEEKQVIKARIKREDNPDYWETSRPLAGAGMKSLPGKKRNMPINKNVVYLDFRSELSAFDKYFYFETPPAQLVSRTRQEYLRYRSKTLKKLFERKKGVVKARNGSYQNEDLIILSKEEVEVISEILGKKYLECKIIKHKLFHNWGYSVLLKTNFYNYSEAFAGSGEMSVVRLVHEVLKAKEYSLILLDEPEVSLHPGAQKKLKYFLLDQIKKRKHQIVISTHSPTLIEGLPKEAVKVFFQKIDTGRVIIKENIYPEEAFYFIGKSIYEKITLFVEDKLAEKIISKVLSLLGNATAERFEIKYLPGGASNLKRQIAIFSNSNIAKSFFIMDGDQYFAELCDIEKLIESDKTENNLKKIIKRQTNEDIHFYPDGGQSGGNSDQLIQMMIKFLKYYQEHVFYLPGKIPEDIIWDEETIKSKLDKDDYNGNIDRIHGLKNNKERIYATAQILFGNDTQMEALEDILVKEWLKKEDLSLNEIKDIIETITDRC